MKVLVTGATGFVGNNIVRMLLDQGDSVRVLVRATSAARPLQDLPVERVLGDVREAESVKRAAQDVDAIVHAAGDVHIGWTRKDRMRTTNVEGTRNVLDAAHPLRLRVIYVSTVNALGIGSANCPATEETPIQGNVRCGYVVTKQEAEQLAKQYAKQGLDIVIVNPGYMLGPWDWKPSSGEMLRSFVKYYMPLAPWGGCSVCDVRDVCAAIVTLLHRTVTGQQYILAGTNLPYLDFWQMLARITGGWSPIMRMGPAQRIALGLWGDFWTKVLPEESPLNSAMLGMSKQFHYYSSARAQAELGYQIRPAEESALDAWRWMREYGIA